MTDTAPAPTADKEEGRHRPRRKHQQPRPGKPRRRKGRAVAARKINPVLERLFELYPKLFGARFLPLKLGVFEDLLAPHADEFKREDLKIALGLHARSTRYLEAVAAGKQRHDLNGVAVEPVAPEHVHHAILEVFRRRQARSAEDLRPQLRARLMEAIEASGLSREDYMLVVRSNDETSPTPCSTRPSPSWAHATPSARRCAGPSRPAGAASPSSRRCMEWIRRR